MQKHNFKTTKELFDAGLKKYFLFEENSEETREDIIDTFQHFIFEQFNDCICGEIVDKTTDENILKRNVLFVIKIGNKEMTFDEFDKYYYNKKLLIEKL
jgi:hypothetical protein